MTFKSQAKALTESSSQYLAQTLTDEEFYEAVEEILDTMDEPEGEPLTVEDDADEE